MCGQAPGLEVSFAVIPHPPSSVDQAPDTSQLDKYYNLLTGLPPPVLFLFVFHTEVTEFLRHAVSMFHPLEKLCYLFMA